MTREEAIKEVKSWDFLAGKEIEAIETLIPELRESDDDRIRKEMIAYFQDIKEVATKSENLDKWIAYLEKQKEQKPEEWSDDWQEEDVQTRFAFYTYKDDPSVLYLSNVFVEETSRNHGFGTRILRAAEKVAETIGATTISLKVKQNSPANAWYRKNGYGYVAFEDGYDWLEKNLEYIKPDKSVEWSEKEMADCMKLTVDVIEYYFDAENPIRDKLIHWFKSLRSQPKQEWSEEDKEMLMKVEQILLKFWNSLSDSFYHKYDDENQDAESCYNWVKSLPLNFKKKNEDVAKLCSNEWGEEEQQIIENAACTLISFSNIAETKKEEEELCELASKLQDLKPQPHWKPSKEQMGTLKQWLQDHKFDGDSRYVYPVFCSLFSDLQKI